LAPSRSRFNLSPTWCQDESIAVSQAERIRVETPAACITTEQETRMIQKNVSILTQHSSLNPNQNQRQPSQQITNHFFNTSRQLRLRIWTEFFTALKSHISELELRPRTSTRSIAHSNNAQSTSSMQKTSHDRKHHRSYKSNSRYWLLTHRRRRPPRKPRPTGLSTSPSLAITEPSCNFIY
jgi:hypothetical protein